MKGGFVAAAAVLAAGANAHAHQHAHELFHRHNAGAETDLCTTIWSTIVGPPGLVPCTTSTTKAPVTTHAPPPPPPPPPVTTTAVVTTEVILPTPQVHSCPGAGVCSWSATTITVDQTTTVCVDQTTSVPSGSHTIGGVTTVVVDATTVVCPYASVSTSGSVTTSIIETTTYVCPSAGTYTIAPTTTYCPTETVVTYVTPTVIVPGTYTAPAKTVTVTDNQYVTYCPFENIAVSVFAAPPPPPAQTTKAYAVPPPPPAQVTKAYAVPPPPSAHSSKPSSAPPSGSHGRLGSDNDHYGLTYTPYVPETGECKSASEVDAEISAIKGAGFSVVRLYSTDCSGLENVGNACVKHGLDLIVGIFVKEAGCSSKGGDIKQQLQTLSAWNHWDIVKLVVVANEAIQDGICTPEQLGQLIDDTKAACSQYTGPYTIAETLNIWQNPEVSATLCDKVDVAGANIHAYFNPQTTPDKAGEFVATELKILGDICPGKAPLNLECGWPTKGHCLGSACPGEREQAIAIKSIRDTCGGSVVFFSTDNDMWKDAGSCGCDQSWGCKSLFGL